MKTIAYFTRVILLSLAFIVTGCSDNTQFTFLNGDSHTQSDYNGQWLVVNFWAQWCAPCIEEIPEINRLAADGSKTNLTVIGVSYDDLTNQALLKIVKEVNIQYPVIATDPIPILSFSLPPTLPTNYIINPEGEVVVKLVGKQTYESLKKAVEDAKTSYN